MAQTQPLVICALLLYGIIGSAVGDCPPLSDPTNGDVHYSIPAVTDVQASYTCQEGYQPAGTHIVLVCQADDTWKGVPPTCEPNDCGGLTTPANGQISVGGTTYGEKRTFTCDAGYTLKGASTVTCQASGSWDNLAPSCDIKDCGGLNTPDNGQISVGDTTYGATRTFTCDAGYTLKGASTVTCQASGSWDNSVPTCDIKDCGTLTTPVNGQMSTGGTTYGATRTFTCNTGYTRKGASTVTCQASGSWDNSVPSCVIKDCGALTTPVNGQMSTGVTTYGATLTFTCNTGYTLKGASTVTCQASGSWDNSAPSCVIKDCGNPSITNGKVDTSGGTKYQAVIIYSCDTGYTLNGNAQRTCQDDGQYSSSLPSCDPVDCGDPGRPNFGTVDTSPGTTFERQIIFACNEGYAMTAGFNSAICLADGSWTAKPPTCTIKDCGGLTTPNNGQMSTGDTTYGATRTFTCDTGYTLTGATTVTCQASGSWDNSAPSCVIKDCGNPSITNGKVDTSGGTKYQAVITYSCDTGYTLNGNPQRTCQDDGQYSGSLPSCDPVDCGDPGPPKFGTVDTSPGTTFESQIIFACNEGYTMTAGFDSAICLANEQWTANPPTCTIKDCGTLSAPVNGQISTGVTTYGATRTFTCTIGYVLTGASSVTCLATGKWDGSKPNCDKKDCGGRNHPDNGRVSLFNGDTTYGASASYTCNTGYQLKGDNTLKCTMTGWIPANEPTCQIWGKYYTFTYICNTGYQLKGDNTLECTMNGWYPEEPTCQILDCGDPGSITNGKVDSSGGTLYPAEVGYSCDVGYTLKGNAKRTCQDLGKYSGSLPSCDPVDCGDPGTPNSGTIDKSSGTTFGNTITFTCNQGYDLTGTGVTSAECQANGAWTFAPPTCTKHDCGGRNHPDNGRVGTLNGDTTYGAFASYTCNTGYQLKGDNSLECTMTGWDPANEPTCQIWDCGDPGSITNGKVDSSGGTLYSAEVSYSCDTGYTLKGNAKRTCQDLGKYSGSLPSCDPVDCGNPSDPVNGGRTSISGTTYTNTATFFCDTGHVMNGSPTATCQASGQWTAIPTCTRYDCGGRSNQDNGQVNLVGGDTTYGAVATYTCNTGYQLKGESKLECTMKGWDPTDAPRCEIWDCGDPGSPANGEVDSSGGTQYQAVVTYSCNTGYTRDGNAQRTCQDGGQWTGSLPSCRPMDCGSPGDPDNGGTASISGTMYTNIATFFCDTGYVMNGSPTATCQASGQWTAIPTCTRYDCGGRSNPDNGQVRLVGGDTTYGAVATYTCNTGYQLKGANTLECTMIGWDPADAPTCQIWDCGRQLDTPDNGRINIPAVTQYLSTVTYTCNTGYSLLGSATRTCQDDGNWSDTTPKCVIVDCGQLMFPGGTDNLIMNLATSNTFGMTTTFSCETGYILEGEASVTCAANGQWSGATPTCTPVNCGELSNTIDNGQTVKTGITYGHTIIYTCNQGFRLSVTGETTLTLSCQASGSWDNTAPECMPVDCGSLEAPVNGQVHAPSSTYLEIAAYTCNPGYNLAGTNHRQCEANSKWSRQVPSCNPVDCGDLFPIGFGSVNMPGGTTFGQLATYTCFTGYYVSSGDDIRTCQASGNWDGTQPVCSIQNCGPLSTDLENGAAAQTGVTYDQTTTYTCNAGYYITTPGQSSLVVTCQDDGNWDGTRPTCTPVSCPTLSNPVNGEVQTLNSRLDAVATYVCSTGYRLEGNNQRTCQATGQWSGTVPSCIAIDCGVAPTLEFGEVNTPSGTMFGKVATYTCRTGYFLQGKATRTCGQDENWDGALPTCKLHDCGSLSSTIDNGQVVMTGTSYQDTYIYTCDRGYHITGTPDTSRTLTCTDTGDWSSTVPTCVLIDCGPLDSPTNGDVSTTDGSLYQSTATYTCATGYQLSSTATRNCQVDGTWDGAQPSCMVYDCESLNNPENGLVVTLGGTTYLQMAEYSCNQGYVLTDGDTTRTCGPMGAWGGQEPRCQLYDCGSVEEPADGTVSLSAGTLPDSVATYTCNQGYFISDGSRTRDCVFLNGWTDAQAICTIHDCQDLVPPENGVVKTDDGTTYDKEAVYMCNAGYFISAGSEKRMCQDNGQWSGTIPTCTLYVCSSLSNPPDGFVSVQQRDFGEHADYTCRTGYFISAGSTIRMCMTGSSSWTGSEPTCTIYDCGDITSTLENGQVSGTGNLYGDERVYTCNSGYLIAGTSSRTSTVMCNATGVWSAESPTCQPVDCGVPDTLENGKFTETGTGLGTVTTYSCNEEYRLEGQSRVTCEDSGQWSGTAPQCTLYDCGPLTDPAQGTVTVTKETFGGVGTYLCDTGYNISSGSERRECLDGGSWSGAQPVCTIQDCGALSTVLENGVGLQSGTQYSDMTTYRCNLGYHILGRTADSTIIICTATGQWSDGKPECVIVDCGQLQAPPNGEIDLSDGSLYLAVATYRCKTGYRLVGVGSIICQDSGSWSNAAPSCEIYDCGDLNNPENGIVDVSGGITYGSVARYTCAVGYYINYGSEMRTCMDDGKWSGLEPKCADVTTIACGFRDVDLQIIGDMNLNQEMEQFRLGVMMLEGLIDKADIDSGSTRFSLITYSNKVIDNYSFLLGNVSSREQLKSYLNYERAIPLTTSFNITGALETLSYISNNTNFGNRPDVSDVAFLITDSLGLVTPSDALMADGIRQKGVILNIVALEAAANSPGLASLAFSEAHVYRLNYTDMPQLAATMFEQNHCDCGSQPYPANGVVDLSDGVYYLDQAVFSCNPGYRLIDLDPLVCQYDGDWDRPAPVCIEIDCGPLANPEHGVVMTNGTGLSSTATYTCNMGYSLQGVGHRVCNDSGTWHPSQVADNTTCVLIDCGPLTTPANGIMASTGTTYGHQARFICISGYSLEGEAEITCQDNGEWSSQEPECQLPKCGLRNSDILVMVGMAPWMSVSDFNLHVKPAIKYLIGKSDLDNDSSRFTFFFFDDTIRDNAGSLFESAPRSDMYRRIDSIQYEASRVDPNVSLALEVMQELFSVQGYGSRPGAHNVAMLVTDQVPLSTHSLNLIQKVEDGGISVAVVGIVNPMTAVLQGNGTIIPGVGGLVSYMEWQLLLRMMFEFPHCDCGPLQRPNQAVVSVFGTYYQDQAFYTCNSGYMLKGPESRVCLYSGNWDGNDPSCVEVDCGPLQQPGNGTMVVPGTTLGSTVRFTCDTGYQLVGANMTTCETSGNWSNAEPVCEWRIMSCGQLSDLVDGKVSLSVGLSVGSVATYSCNTGYFLVGNASRLCLDTGMWDGQQPCCQIHDCGPLEKPTNGNMVVMGTQYGGVATFTCSMGFQLFGADTLTCTSDGTWSDQVPMCRQTDCGPLSNVPNGTVRFTTSTFGQLAGYTCNPGYVMDGPGTRVCLADGQWSGAPPTCLPRDCGPLLPPVNGQVDVTNGTVYGDVATYSCNQGYRLDGATTTTCTATGIWQPFSAPACLEISCGQPSLPDNVSVTLQSGTSFGSRATFSCDMGYQLTGSNTALCTDQGQWNIEQMPVCNIMDCGDLPGFKNGAVSLTGGTVYGSVAQYSCNPGYLLQGLANVRTCSASGIWFPTFVQMSLCVIKDCGTPGRPVNGMVETSGTTYGSVASYACDTGYILERPDIRNCSDEGRWFPLQEPSCTQQDCGEVPPAFTNGMVRYSSETGLGSIATFSCNPGYQLVGSKTLTCLGTGQWSGNFPECKAPDCDQLSVNNGMVKYTDNLDLTRRAQYSCNQGYYLTGPAEKLCTLTGWTPNTTTTCNLHNCGNPGRPVNGALVLPGGTTYGQVAQFSCNLGYTMVGSQSITCQGNGNWSAPTPVCMTTDCLDLPNPDNGSVSATETTFGHVAVYVCNEGYTLAGISSRICMPTGSWSGQAPTCNIKDCGMHQEPTFGSVSFPKGTMYSMNALYSCDQGYTLMGQAARVCGPSGFWVGDMPSCRIIDCGQFPVVLNGNLVTSTSNTFGSVATYACDTGNKMTGSAQVTCLTTGQWTTPPTCSIISCGSLPNIAQGSVDISGGDTFGQVAMYSCNTGYKLDGNQMRTCTDTGRWNGSQPSCVIIDCGPLENPSNGQVTTTGTSFGDSAIYTCNLGYSLEGTPNTLCQANGSWGGSSPSCLIRDCGELRTPINGQKTLSSGTTYGSVAEFTCDLLYDLVGTSSVVCQADGSWSGNPPACARGDQLTAVDMLLELNLTIADSVDLQNDATAFMYAAAAKAALLAYYRSIMGSDLHDIIITLVQKGSLIVQFTVVMRNRTEAFTEYSDATSNVASGAAGVSIFNSNTFPLAMQVDGSNVDLGMNRESLQCMTYLAAHGPCDQGYLCSVTNMVAACLPDQNTDCGQPGNPVNGRVDVPGGTLYGATLTYTCNTGYTLDGDGTSTCQPSGNWKPAQPSCKVTDCEMLSNPANGAVSMPGGTTYMASARYSCMAGYTLIGTADVTCQASGLWSSPPPLCLITRCGTLSHPPNGNVTLSSDGQTAMYRCNLGYRLVGNSMRTCLQSGQWNGNDATCEIITCGTLTNPPNGMVDMSSGLSYGQTVTYSCVDPEYELTGSRIRTCREDGSWSGAVPSCSLRDCGMLDMPSNGNMVMTGTKYGDTARFTCNTAYSLQGAALLTCLETGWDNQQPSCRHIGDCGTLSHPTNGAVDVSEGTSIGSVAKYQCYTGYVLDGMANRECLPSSQWAGTPPSCRIQTCPNLNDPAGGSVQLSGGLTYGQKATYTCNLGYEMVGPAEVTCQEDGTWSGLTICKIINCGPLTHPLHGLVDVVAGTEYGAMAKYTCNPGYTLKGTSTRRCHTDGKWSNSEPSCMPKDCGAINELINGTVNLPGGTTFGNTVTYMCDVGYNMTGTSQRQCGADGQWTGSPPICGLIECGTISAPSNGRIMLTQGAFYGSVAIYTCDNGYMLVGVHYNRTCMGNRLWSGTPPSCVLVDCGVLSTPLFGSVSLSSGTTYGSTAVYTCNTGYMVDGVTERACRADGMWGAVVPSCVVVDCGALPTPKNGQVSTPQGTGYGRIATYTCDSDYDLDGAKTLTCQADGTWSQVAPSCDSGTNFELAIGLGVGLSGFFIIVLIVILVAVIMYRRNMDRHELRMKKYGTRSRLHEMQTPVPTASYPLPMKTKPQRSFYMPHFRPVEDAHSEVSDYRTGYSRFYYNNETALPREEHVPYTMRYRP